MYAAAAVFAAGVVGVGAVSVLSPAWAGPGASGPGPFGPAVTAPVPGHGMHGWGGGTPMGAGGAGTGMSTGMHNGAGMGWASGAGPGAGTGTCPLPTTVPSGTLTEDQQTVLAGMAEEEKLSHDLYQAFADAYDSVLFARIATAESHHLAAVRTLLDRYGITDPTAGKPTGQFTSAEVQAAYDAYLSEGNASLNAALGVGEKVERASITALDEAREGLAAPDVALVYGHLLAGSQHHLTAFSR